MYDNIFYWLLLCVSTYIPDVWCIIHHDYHTRIVGGDKVKIQQYPYMAYLRLNKENETIQCGGVIISENSILTAAHCLNDVETINVRTGSTYRMSGGYEYTSTTFIQHPLYRPGSFDYDVGLIDIDEGLDLDGKTTNTIRIENMSSNPRPGEYVTVTGWGSTKENGPPSMELQMAKVEVQNTTSCEETDSEFTRRQFCAGGDGVDTCQGDSGGPAVGETYTVVGITSSGVGCGREGKPGIYTRVSNFRIRIFISTYAGV